MNAKIAPIGGATTGKKLVYIFFGGRHVVSSNMTWLHKKHGRQQANQILVANNLKFEWPMLQKWTYSYIVQK